MVNRFFFSKWFKKGIISIKDLLTESGNFLTFQEFSLKYSCQTNFLQYCQVISAVPKHLLSIAKQTNGFDKLFFTSNDNIFPLSETVQINLGKAWFKRRILHAPNRIAKLNACKMRRLNQLNAAYFNSMRVSRICD